MSPSRKESDINNKGTETSACDTGDQCGLDDSQRRYVKSEHIELASASLGEKTAGAWQSWVNLAIPFGSESVAIIAAPASNWFTNLFIPSSLYRVSQILHFEGE